MDPLPRGESPNLFAGDSLVPERRDRTEDAAGDQAVDGGLAYAEGGGAFVDRIGQARNGIGGNGGVGFHGGRLRVWRRDERRCPARVGEIMRPAGFAAPL